MMQDHFLLPLLISLIAGAIAHAHGARLGNATPEHIGMELHAAKYDEANAVLSYLRPPAVRTFFCFKYLTYHYPVDESLTVSDIQANPEPHIAEFNKHVDWHQFDMRVNASVANGVETLLIAIAEGQPHCLPNATLKASGANVPLDPNYVTPETYWAYNYLFVRSTVRRYKQHVKYWQLENELNFGYMAVLAGIRYGPHGHSFVTHAKPSRPYAYMEALKRLPLQGLREECGYWANDTFVDATVAVLHAAVKDESPDASTLTNALCDINNDFAAVFGLRPWTAALSAWRSSSDVFGLDMYFNRFTATPYLTWLIENAVEAAAALTTVPGSRGPAVPVWVTEIGYPTWHAAPTRVPAIANFTTARQAEFFKAALAAAGRGGAEGFFVFGLWDGNGLTPPPGGYQQEDTLFLTAGNATYVTGNLTPLFAALLSNASYVTSGRLFELLQGMAGHDVWACFDSRVQPLPCAALFRGVFAQASEALPPV